MSHPTRNPLAGYSRELQTRILENLLLEKGFLTPETVDGVNRFFEEEMNPINGARVVARAWVDPAFKKRPLLDVNSVIREIGLSGGIEGEVMTALENTDAVHNVVVCSLCSCYAWPLLGLPPVWYKSTAYRARVVREPRRVLSELGLDLPDSVEVRVWETSGHVRYIVIPKRPRGTEGMSEDRLASLVTPEAMMGVSEVKFFPR